MQTGQWATESAIVADDKKETFGLAMCGVRRSVHSADDSMPIAAETANRWTAVLNSLICSYKIAVGHVWGTMTGGCHV